MGTPSPLHPIRLPARNLTVTDGGAAGAQQEFLVAIESYRRMHGRPFPTWSEILEIAESLGYRKPSRAVRAVRVVVVEMHAATRESLQRELMQRGFDVLAVGTVAGAIAALDPAPEFLILDLSLPDGDGEKVLAAVRGKHLGTRVAIAAVIEDRQLWERARRLRPDILLPKPFRLDDVLLACARPDPGAP